MDSSGRRWKLKWCTNQANTHQNKTFSKHHRSGCIRGKAYVWHLTPPLALSRVASRQAELYGSSLNNEVDIWRSFIFHVQFENGFCCHRSTDLRWDTIQKTQRKRPQTFEWQMASECDWLATGYVCDGCDAHLLYVSCCLNNEIVYKIRVVQII